MRSLALALILSGTAVLAEDWPQFLGPRRNGSSLESLPARFGSEGPRPLWKVKVGEGFAAPVVAGGTAVVFHRLNDREELLALETASGRELWRASYPASYRDDFGFEEGPRGTPAIVEGRVYAMGADGIVSCHELATGQMVWRVDTRKQFGARKGFFGMACSPLVEAGRVLLNVGGEPAAGIIGLDAATGAVAWKADADEASHSSPVTAEMQGKRHAIFFTREGLAVLDPVNGRIETKTHWRPRMHASVNAASPLVENNRIFLSTSYGQGAALFEFDGKSTRTIWSGDDILSCHYATPVRHEGFLYGFDGRQEQGPSLVCVEWATGKLRWREERFGAGTVTLAGNRLLLLLESGELVIAPASPAKFRPEGRWQILGSSVRAYPALANNRLFARDKNNLAAFSLKGD